MKCPLLAAVMLCCASSTRAALVVNVEQRTAVGGTFPVARQIPLQVYLDPGPVDIEDERLAGFRLKLELGNAQPDGVRFSLPPGPPSPAHPPVFPGVGFMDLGSDYNTIFVSAALPPGEGVNVTPIVNGLFTATVEIPANVTPHFIHLVTIDPLDFGFFDVNGAPVVAAPGRPGGVITPEPAACMTALAAVGVLTLRRRGRARC
jgi:hypothetical protein